MNSKRNDHVRTSCASIAGLALVSLIALSSSARAQEAPTPAAADHQPPVSAKINTLAHKVLQAGLKTNALGGDGLKPWHLKIDYQMHVQGSPKPETGTLEEWHVSPDKWRRTFTGMEAGMNGSEWSVSPLERYETKAEQDFVGRRLITLRIARPVIDPLYQAANIKPEYAMDVTRATSGALTLNCVSLINARQYAEETDPDWLFPTMCFDSDLHLRATNAGDTSVEFDDLQPFQNRFVARTVKVIQNGVVITELKVSLLEAWDAADADRLTPAKDAVAEPFRIEPGHPMPEPVYEVGAHVPLRPDGYPYRGTVVVPILLHKDGSVQVLHFSSGIGASRDLVDAVEMAVAKWKFKPYIVDGQPVEVRIGEAYVLDGKPFVPTYERPKPAPVNTAPGDYSSTFDPKRDPEKDLAMAVTAAAGHKRILMEVGGSWCSWCHVMDKFFADHADVLALRDENFVFMKVNMGPTNENSVFLSRFPKVPGYPYLFVLDSDGKMLQAKNTDDLELGGGYNAKLFNQFLSSAKAH